MSELMDYAPDFSTYSYKELLEAKRYINREEYPERYDRVVELLKDPDRWQKEQTEDAIGVEANKYATFWPRFWAAVIDSLILGLIVIVERLVFGIDLTNDDK
ncbi:RDD family protein [Shewanella rhizosphaerae]|uniref:RDD family protein n=1 Tax=Shewanella rhizosphaerae TaxID=2864207 RepID=UPI0021AD4708|nr:RDD family protein [Shewanella rhizosphaerae]